MSDEWDSTKESISEEDEKVATIAIHKSSSSPRLFTNISDDDYYSPHICFMAKGEKVKSKSKAKAPPPPPPSDISIRPRSFHREWLPGKIPAGIGSQFIQAFITWNDSWPYSPQPERPLVN